jgi:hypothetical protein
LSLFLSSFSRLVLFLSLFSFFCESCSSHLSLSLIMTPFLHTPCVYRCIYYTEWLFHSHLPLISSGSHPHPFKFTLPAVPRCTIRSQRNVCDRLHAQRQETRLWAEAVTTHSQVLVTLYLDGDADDGFFQSVWRH